MTWAPNTLPSLDDFEVIARATRKTLPYELARHVTDVVIRIADFPDTEIQRELGLQSPFDLLGLYQGVSLDLKSVAYAAHDVDMIFLYRRPILDYCADTDEDFRDVAAELRLDVVEGGDGVLHRVVQKPGTHRRHVEAELTDDVGHLEGVGEIGLTVGTRLTAVHLRAENIRPTDQICIRVGMVAQ